MFGDGELGVCGGERGLLELFGGELGVICGGERGGLLELFGGEVGVCGGGDVGVGNVGGGYVGGVSLLPPGGVKFGGVVEGTAATGGGGFGSLDGRVGGGGEQ